MPQHRSSTVTPGPMPALTASARISPAVMKLSCPTNWPDACADTRARFSARSNGARSSCLIAVVPSRPSARDLAAPGSGGLRRRAERRDKVHGRRTPEFGGKVRASQAGPATGLIAQVLLLAVLQGIAGLGAAGRNVGIVCAVSMTAALGHGLGRGLGDRLGPASWVTLARATLAVGVAALVADSFAHDTPVALLVTLSAVALALDLIDGWVARRTGTASALGARFDGEVDAFLILALSVYVAREVGAWVLAIGAARYLFLLGEWLLP